MHANPMKFENKNRLEEINAKENLIKMGVGPGQRVCDYGAGTGIISVEAAKLQAEKVYALDRDPKMLEIIDTKYKEDFETLETILVQPDAIPVQDGFFDVFYMVTVLHEIEDVPMFVKEVKRVVKKGGKVGIIDFHKDNTPMGPPLDRRMSPYQAARHFFREGISLVDQETLGDNLYFLVLQA